MPLNETDLYPPCIDCFVCPTWYSYSSSEQPDLKDFHPCRLDIVFPGLPDELAETREQCDRTTGRTRIHAKICHQPGKRFSSFSSASAFQGLFPQPLYVAHRWDTEEAFILPIEVGGVVVPHAIGRTSRVEVFTQHQTTGLLQPQQLLELQGAHRRDGFEVVVEPR